MLWIGIALGIVLWSYALAVGFTYGARAVVTGDRIPPPDRSEAGGARAQALGAAARELVVSALTVAIWPLGLIPPRLQRRRGDGAPILIVPGATMTWTACLPLATWLARRLDNPIAVVSCTPLFGPPERVASFLTDRIHTLSGVADGAPVHVIGLGEGGLSLRLAAGLDETLPIGKLVTVAAPTMPPRMGVFLPGGTARYKGLGQVALAHPDLGVRSDGDNLVMPGESNLPEGCAELILPTDGHLSTWYSPRTWREVLQILANTPEAGG